MMSCERQKNLVHQKNVLEIIDHSLSVEIIHGHRQEVPADTRSAARSFQRKTTGLKPEVENSVTEIYH